MDENMSWNKAGLSNKMFMAMVYLNLRLRNGFYIIKLLNQILCLNCLLKYTGKVSYLLTFIILPIIFKTRVKK